MEIDNSNANLNQENVVPASILKRVGALLIDSLLLAILGMIIGLFFSSYLSKLTWQGRLIGLSVTLAYFSIQNSKINDGQTIGKQLFRIKVVDHEGHPISFQKSFLRAFILVFPFFLNGWALSFFEAHKYISNFILMVIITSFFLSLYFFIFNFKTRQSIHDLLVKTYVIQDKNFNSYNFFKNDKIHYYISGTILVIIFATVFFVIPKNVSKKDYEEMNSIIAQTKKISHLYNPFISKVQTTFKKYSKTSEPVKTSKTIQISLCTTDGDIYYRDVANKIAAITLDSKLSKDVNNIIITISYGYDIGIARFWNSTHFTYTKEKWQKIVHDYFDENNFEGLWKVKSTLINGNQDKYPRIGEKATVDLYIYINQGAGNFYYRIVDKKGNVTVHYCPEKAGTLQGNSIIFKSSVSTLARNKGELTFTDKAGYFICIFADENDISKAVEKCNNLEDNPNYP